MSWYEVLSVIKIEAHTKRCEPKYQERTLGDFHTKAATTESIKVIAHIDAVHSASSKKLPGSFYPNAPVTWQQSVP